MSWTKSTLPVKELASGDTLTIETHTINQNLPGPHIHIQASVHGAELQGNAVILKLMERLNSLTVKGSITFVPVANPFATNNKHGTYTYGRYNPITGDNWNRNYVDIIKDSNFDLDSYIESIKDLSWSEIKTSYKIKLKEIFKIFSNDMTKKRLLSGNNKLNIQLQELACSADAILDLHTGPVATRYLYSAEYEKDTSLYLNFKHVLLIPNEFGGAMDEAAFMPWIHLKDGLNQRGIEIDLDIDSFTLEFGSEESFSMKEATKDVESIINYLQYKGVLDGEPKLIETHLCELKDYKTIYAPSGGLVDYHVKPGESFDKGELLASFYNFKNLDPNNPMSSTVTKVEAQDSGIIINRCPSSSVHEGMELFQVMTKLTTYKGAK